MLLLIFSFLAGIVTALSPCVLPILPILLASGTFEGRLRPLGTVGGVVCSFSFFTIALSSIVHATGISPHVLRSIAIGLVFLFGLIAIFPRLSNMFASWTAPIARVGQKIQSKKKTQGFWGGMALGVALGFLWTPCAGPILGTITTLVATREINATAVGMTLLYSIGAAIPMLLFTYGGSWLVHTSRFLARYSERIRQFFGILMIAFATLLTFHWDILLQKKIARFVPELFSEKDVFKKPSETKPAPEIVGITGWMNSEPLTLAALKGKVILLDFWSSNCVNCFRTLPYLKNWYHDYKDDGFVIIGVHSPGLGKKHADMAQVIKELGIEYPIALDDHLATWKVYGNRYWPTHCLIDKEGRMVYVHVGAGEYVEMENAIRKLLGLRPLK